MVTVTVGCPVVPRPRFPSVGAVETWVLRVLMGLPRPVMRRLAGPAVVREGDSLDLETQ